MNVYDFSSPNVYIFIERDKRKRRRR
jgi:hypothetical protein